MILIKSFEIFPIKSQANIYIESGIKFCLKFMCYKKDAMLDLNIHVKTIDGISVFKISRMFGEVGMKDSKIGLYTMGFELKPYTINT